MTTDKTKNKTTRRTKKPSATKKPIATAPQEQKPDTVLILRCCRADMTSDGINGRPKFSWPESGPVEAPDWNPEPVCGQGLHGWLWGVGDLGACDYWQDTDAKWLVVEVTSADVVVGVGELVGKCKFPRGTVIYCGDRTSAANLVRTRAPDPGQVMFVTATAGERGTATAGDGGQATAGERGTATAGYRGTATAGDGGQATAGYRGTATAGERGTATAGERGTATAGERGTATAGDGGQATAGYRGTATAGERGTATAGYRGTATAGHYGTATAGKKGILVIRSWDEKSERHRLHVAYVGENGIEPNVRYKLDGDKFTPVT